MSDSNFLADLLSKTSNLILPYENIKPEWCVLEGNIFYKADENDEDVIPYVKTIPEAYEIARKEDLCYLCFSEVELNGRTILTGAIIDNKDISGNYSQWWEFRLNTGEYPGERVVISRYLKVLTFNRAEYPFMNMLTDELGIFIHIQPRYTKDIGNKEHILTFPNRAIILQKFSDPKWMWKLVYINREYIFSVKFTVDIDSIFKRREQYDKFTVNNPDVVTIGLVVKSINDWIVNYYDVNNVMIETNACTGNITTDPNFSFVNYLPLGTLIDNDVNLDIDSIISITDIPKETSTSTKIKKPKWYKTRYSK